MELPNKERMPPFKEKENYQYLEILEVDTIKQAEMKEKIRKIIQTNEKTSGNKALQEKSHQRNNHFDSPIGKVLWTILYEFLPSSFKDSLKDNEIDDYAKGTTSKRQETNYKNQTKRGIDFICRCLLPDRTWHNVKSPKAD